MPKILGRTGGDFRVTKALKAIMEIGRGSCYLSMGLFHASSGPIPHLYCAAVSSEEGALPMQHIMWASALTQPPLIMAELKVPMKILI